MAGPLRAGHARGRVPSRDGRGRLDAVVDVGREREDEGYSGFENSDLAQILRDHDVDEVYVCGLATDYCVRASAIDACREGFEVTVVEDAIRGVEVNEGDSERALAEMREAGARTADLGRAPGEHRGSLGPLSRYPTTTLPFIFARSAISPERASAATRARSALPSIRIRSGSERSSSSACLVSGGSSTRAAIP